MVKKRVKRMGIAIFFFIVGFILLNGLMEFPIMYGIEEYDKAVSDNWGVYICLSEYFSMLYILIGWICVLLGSVFVLRNNGKSKAGKFLCMVSICGILIFTFFLFYNIAGLKEEWGFEFARNIRKAMNAIVRGPENSFIIRTIDFLVFLTNVLQIVSYLFLLLVFEDWMNENISANFQKKFRACYLANGMLYVALECAGLRAVSVYMYYVVYAVFAVLLICLWCKLWGCQKNRDVGDMIEDSLN